MPTDLARTLTNYCNAALYCTLLHCTYCTSTTLPYRPVLCCAVLCCALREPPLLRAVVRGWLLMPCTLSALFLLLFFTPAFTVDSTPHTLTHHALPYSASCSPNSCPCQVKPCACPTRPGHLPPASSSAPQAETRPPILIDPSLAADCTSYLLLVDPVPTRL